MSKSTAAAAGLTLLLALPLASGLQPPPQETLQLKQRDHQDLGEKIAEYFQAQRETKDIEKKREDLVKALEKISKKQKGVDVLSMTADLGQAFWYSFEYDGQKGIRKGKVVDESVPFPHYGEDYEVEYALHAPAKYKASSGPYPLILSIAEEGVAPAQHITEEWIDPELKKQVIIVCCKMPDDVSMWATSGGRDKPGGVGNLLITLRTLWSKYAVDFDRVFIAGRGVGVDAAVHIAAQMPDRFAGVIGRAGDVSDGVRVDNFCSLPTYFAGGGSGVTKFDEAVRAAGYDNCTIQAEGKDEDVLAWLQSTTRMANPEKVVLVPSSPNPRRAYWIEVPNADYEGKARIVGTVDRATNTITLESEGIASATVSFNDVLLDLSKPVKVVCNGVENVDAVPRNLNLALSMFFNASSDPGKVYVNQVTYDLPAGGGDE